jgi:hypothetical protein
MEIQRRGGEKEGRVAKQIPPSLLPSFFVFSLRLAESLARL